MGRFYPGPKVKMQLSRNYFSSTIARIILHNEKFEKVVTLTLTGNRDLVAQNGLSFLIIKGKPYYDGRMEIQFQAKTRAHSSVKSAYICNLKSPKCTQKEISKEVEKRVNQVCQDLSRKVNGLGPILY